MFGVVVFAIVLQCMWLNEPWDGSHAGFNSGNFCGYSCRGFERHGYFNVGGIPSTIHHAGDGDFYVRYVNHPPTLYFLLYPSYLLLGGQEASINFAMLLVMIFTLVSMRVFLAKIYGIRVAAVATMVFASLPVIVQFMRMADPVVFCMPFLIPTAYFWFRHLRLKSKGSLFAYVLVGFMAGMMDWHVYFIVMALWFDLVFSQDRSWKRLFYIGLPFGLALITTGLWIALASTNSLEEIGDFLVMTKSSVLGQTKTYGPSLITDPDKAVQIWFSRVGNHFAELIQLPVIAVSGLGMLLLLWKRGKQNVELRFALVLLIAGAIPFGAAYGHAFVHEFWPIMLAPAFAVTAAIILARLAGSGRAWSFRPILASVLLLVLVGFGFVASIKFHGEHRRDHPKTVALAMNNRFSKNDLVLSASGLCSQRFYANFTMISNVFHPDLYERVMQQLYDSQDQFSKLYIFWPKDARRDYHWLEAGNFPVNYAFREDFDGIDTAIVELDLKKAFARIKKK